MKRTSIPTISPKLLWISNRIPIPAITSRSGNPIAIGIEEYAAQCPSTKPISPVPRFYSTDASSSVATLLDPSSSISCPDVFAMISRKFPVSVALRSFISNVYTLPAIEISTCNHVGIQAKMMPQKWFFIRESLNGLSQMEKQRTVQRR